MATNNTITFNDLCEKYNAWIIKYCPVTSSCPLFLVWYTDTDENATTRLLTYKSGEIFAATSLTDFKSTLLSEINDLTVTGNLHLWLDSFSDPEAVESSSHDIGLISTNISENILDIPTLERFSEFVNLCDDFIYQDEVNFHLKVYLENELIQETWNYYYEYIFWPRFNDKEKFETWDRPQLKIDTQELLLKIQDLIIAFEEKIKPASFSPA